MRLMRSMRGAACLMGFVLLAGCSVFQSPTPKTNVAIERFAPVTETDGKGKVKQRAELADSIQMPESWATGSVDLEVEERYVMTPDGDEALESRVLKVKRNSDAGPAAEVAMQRAMSTTDVGSLIGAAVLGAITQGAGIKTSKYAAETEQARIQYDVENALLKAEVEALRAAAAEGEVAEELEE